jgi:hypothetical protein
LEINIWGYSDRLTTREEKVQLFVSIEWEIIIEIEINTSEL